MAIKVSPDFTHALDLHHPEYEEVNDPAYGTPKTILVNRENISARGWEAARSERTLESAARIAANTATLLLHLGMDTAEDEREQNEWLLANPPKVHATEVNRMPPDSSATDILKAITSSFAKNVVHNAEDKHGVVADMYDGDKFLYDGILDISEHKPRFTINSPVASAVYGQERMSDTGAGNVKVTLSPENLYTSPIASKLAALLNDYDKTIVKDVSQLRIYITNKLLEISNCGDVKAQLRALELLGKISDVGLFVEKSELKIMNVTPAALEHAIKDKINRILGRSETHPIEDAEFQDYVPGNVDDKEEE